MQTRRIEAGADGAVEVAQSEVPGHVILRLFVGDLAAGVSLRADEVGQVLAAIAELLPHGGHVALREEQAAAKKPDDFPTPFVSKPTLAQLVRGARVEYEGKPGEVLVGWVEQFGNLAVGYRTSANQELPKAPGVTVGVNQPGSMMMTFLAPAYVPIEKVLRVSCAPDPSPEECWKCHQGGVTWKGGEYPCEVCCRPTMHDQAAAECGHCNGAFTGTQDEVDAHAKVCSTKVRMSPEEVTRIFAAGHDATRVK